jgi:2-polyprenyl-3-methyl-5-hydroxy-6-metoxy-1,4-benzoquinol methylase
MARLLQRRAIGDIRPASGIDTPADYVGHVRKALSTGALKEGDAVLDVGCGTGKLLDALQEAGWQGSYTGIDAFLPPEFMEGDGVGGCPADKYRGIDASFIKTKLEDGQLPSNWFDVAFCFAVLDGVEDLQLVANELQRCVKRSLVILTGLNIPVDDCHTYELTLTRKGAANALDVVVLDELLPPFELAKRWELYNDGLRQIELLTFAKVEA